MKPINLLVAALQLAPVLGTQIHIAVDVNSDKAPSRIENLHNADLTPHTIPSSTDNSDEPYGLTIKKSTLADIQEHVTKDFLAKFPEAIAFQQSNADFRSQKNRQSTKGRYNEVDVKIPALVSCKPRVSEFVKLGKDQVLRCYPISHDDKTCNMRLRTPLKQSYKPAEFIATATIGSSDGDDGGGVSFKAETSYDWVY